MNDDTPRGPELRDRLAVELAHTSSAALLSDQLSVADALVELLRANREAVLQALGGERLQYGSTFIIEQTWAFPTEVGEPA